MHTTQTAWERSDIGIHKVQGHDRGLTERLYPYTLSRNPTGYHDRLTFGLVHERGKVYDGTRSAYPACWRRGIWSEHPRGLGSSPRPGTLHEPSEGTAPGGLACPTPSSHEYHWHV